MANVGRMTTSLPGLWSQEKFWELFEASEFDTTGCSSLKEAVLAKVESDGYAAIRIKDRYYLSVLRKHVPEERLKEVFRQDYLDGDFPHYEIYALLEKDEPDQVSTYFNYTTDDSMATAISELFPEERVFCNWFIDGIGDYGSCVLYRHEVLHLRNGNLNDDLEDAILEEEEPHSSGREREYIHVHFEQIDPDSDELPF